MSARQEHGSGDNRIQRCLRSPWFFSAGLALLFLCIGLVTVLRHELWRDELEHWLIARESASLDELSANTRYTGHPRLWHVCLFLITRATTSPTAMQLFHVLIATAGAFVFLRCAPFGRLHKALFVFGYFPLYEYGVISRNYALGVLLLFCCCASFPARRKRFLGLACLLFLLAQTSVHSLIIGLALTSLLVLEAVFDRDVRASLRRRKADVVLSAVLIVLGVAVSVGLLIPPSDSGFAIGWHTGVDVDRAYLTLTTVWRSWMPFPALSAESWNTNVVSFPAMQGRLSIVLLVLGAVCCARRVPALLLYGMGTAGLLAFFYVKYFGYLRHHGHLYIVLVASLWIGAQCRGSRWERPFSCRMRRVLGGYERVFFSLLLIAQVGAAAFSVAVDWRRPFSAGKAAAMYIMEHGLDQGVIIADRDFAAQAVVGYLDCDVYYPASGRLGTFIVWKEGRVRVLPPFLIEEAERFRAKDKRDVLLVLNYELSSVPDGMIEIARFVNSVVADERFYLYLMRGEPGHGRIEPE